MSRNHVVTFCKDSDNYDKGQATAKLQHYFKIRNCKNVYNHPQTRGVMTARGVLAMMTSNIHETRDNGHILVK